MENFAAMNLKTVVSKLVLAFYFEVGGDTLKEAGVFPSPSNSTFCHVARHSGATVQPEVLSMKVTPVRCSKESASILRMKTSFLVPQITRFATKERRNIHQGH